MTLPALCREVLAEIGVWSRPRTHGTPPYRASAGSDSFTPAPRVRSDPAPNTAGELDPLPCGPWAARGAAGRAAGEVGA